MRKHTMKFLSDLFKGPDGVTWAIGRIYSFIVFIAGIGIIVHQDIRNVPPMDMASLGIGLAGVAAAAGGLIYGTNHVDNPLVSPKE